MANFTQKAIMQEFEDMLKKLPFNKITVSSIVNRCEISPNTFYYHFRDIYDLLDCWVRSKQKEVMANLKPDEPWENTLKHILLELKRNPEIVHHVFDSVSRERLEYYIFSVVENFFYRLVESRTKGIKLPEKDLRATSDFCCYSLLGFFIKYIWSDMEADIDEAVADLSEIMNACIEYTVRKTFSI